MNDVLLFIVIGFAAQIVDGAIGMAYGVLSTTMLMTLGVTPATASAAVHAAEVFTTAASGTAHWRLGNVDRDLVLRLAVPGMIGGAIGAYVAATAPVSVIRPVVNLYLLAIGCVILWRAIRWARAAHRTPRHLSVLGVSGGFLDAVGGGGWGAMVTTTLIGQGTAPRIAIGSANLAEFFVTATITATFVVTVGLSLWPIITGLVIGGVIAAPFAAYAARYLPDRPVMMLVGGVIVLLSLRGLVAVFG